MQRKKRASERSPSCPPSLQTFEIVVSVGRALPDMDTRFLSTAVGSLIYERLGSIPSKLAWSYDSAEIRAPTLLFSAGGWWSLTTVAIFALCLSSFLLASFIPFPSTLMWADKVRYLSYVEALWARPGFADLPTQLYAFGVHYCSTLPTDGRPIVR